MASSINLAPPLPPPPPASGKLTRIVVTGLSDSARAELLSRLPIREGGEWSPETSIAVSAAAKEFDSQLATRIERVGEGALQLTIGPGVASVLVFNTTTGSGAGGASPPSQPAAVPAAQPEVYKVGNGVTPPTVVFKVALRSRKKRASMRSRKRYCGHASSAPPERHKIRRQSHRRCLQAGFQTGTRNGVPVNVRATIEVNFRRQ